MRNYFEGCSTNEEIKARFKQLAKELHPDCGGDAEAFKEMMNQFQQAEKFGWNTFTNKEGKTYTKKATETPQEFADIISKVVHMEGVKIEIIGSWVWLTGNTMQYKDAIKAAGFWWSRNKKAWYHNGDKERTRRRSGARNLTKSTDGDIIQFTSLLWGLALQHRGRFGVRFALPGISPYLF